MRHVTGRLMAASVTALLLVPASASAANLLGNPSFEAPDASGGDVGDAGAPWFNFGAPGTRFTTAFTANTGDQSLKMFGPFDFIGGGTGFGQTLPASPGDNYRARIFAQNNSADPIGGLNFAVIKIEYLDAGFGLVGGTPLLGFNVFESAPIDAGAPLDTWELLGVNGAAAPAGTAFVNFVGVHVQLGDGGGGFSGGAVFMDDASLKLVPTPASLALCAVGGLGLLRRRRA